MTRHGDNGNTCCPRFFKGGEIVADKILLRGGKLANMPALSVRELVFATDENALYIGNGANVRLCGAADKTALDGKLTATQLDALSDLAADSNLATVIGAYNSLLAALKAHGIMKEVI